MVEYDFSEITLTKAEKKLLKAVKHSPIPYNDDFKSLLEYKIVQLTGDTIPDGYGGYYMHNCKVSITEKGLALMHHLKYSYIKEHSLEIIGVASGVLTLLVTIFSLLRS